MKLEVRIILKPGEDGFYLHERVYLGEQPIHLASGLLIKLGPFPLDEAYRIADSKGMQELKRFRTQMILAQIIADSDVDKMWGRFKTRAFHWDEKELGDQPI